MAETKNSKNANYTLLPHRILHPSPPWDPEKNCHKIWVYYIQNDRIEHTKLTKKTAVFKVVIGPRNLRKNVNIMWFGLVGVFWNVFRKFLCPIATLSVAVSLPLKSTFDKKLNVKSYSDLISLLNITKHIDITFHKAPIFLIPSVPCGLET